MFFFYEKQTRNKTGSDQSCSCCLKASAAAVQQLISVPLPLINRIKPKRIRLDVRLDVSRERQGESKLTFQALSAYFWFGLLVVYDDSSKVGSFTNKK